MYINFSCQSSCYIYFKIEKIHFLILARVACDTQNKCIIYGSNLLILVRKVTEIIVEICFTNWIRSFF